MATTFNNSWAFTNASNGQRQWCQHVFDTIVTNGGWVQTADTGQVTISGMTTPGATNTKNGYIVVRTNDSLHSTRPIFIRIDFGSGSAANNPGMWFTIGTGSDGAGTITGKRFDGGAIAAPQMTATASASVSNNYGAGADGAWFTLGMGIIGGGAGTAALAMSFERAKDASGAEDGDGMIWVYGATSATINRVQYLFWAAVTQPTQETGVPTLVSGLNPTSFGGDIGVGLVFAMTGYARPAGLGMTIWKTADLAIEGSAVVSIYGSNHTYKQQGSMTITSAQNGATITEGRCAIRYE